MGLIQFSTVFSLVFILLIKFKRHKGSRIALTLISLFLIPFLFYAYPYLVMCTASVILGTCKAKYVLYDIFSWILIVGITITIVIILIKLNIAPYSKISKIYNAKSEHIKLEQGRKLLQYAILYTVYISIIHVPISLLIIIVSSFSPMVIIYGPYIIISIIMMYIPAIILSINGVIRIRYKIKPLFTVIILMLLPIVNVIMMIIISKEAKRKLMTEGYSLGIFEVKQLI